MSKVKHITNKEINDEKMKRETNKECKISEASCNSQNHRSPGMMHRVSEDTQIIGGRRTKRGILALTGFVWSFSSISLQARWDAVSCVPWYGKCRCRRSPEADGQSSCLPWLPGWEVGGILPAGARTRCGVVRWGCWAIMYKQSVGSYTRWTRWRGGYSWWNEVVGFVALLLDHSKEAGNGDVECTWVVHGLQQMWGLLCRRARRGGQSMDPCRRLLRRNLGRMMLPTIVGTECGMQRETYARSWCRMGRGGECLALSGRWNAIWGECCVRSGMYKGKGGSW